MEPTVTTERNMTHGGITIRLDIPRAWFNSRSSVDRAKLDLILLIVRALTSEQEL